MATTYQSASATSAATATTSEMRKTLIQRVLQLGDEIVDVFDADGEPHQAVADAEARAHVLRQRRMRHDRRMLDEALHAAQAFGERKELAALEKAARCREPASQHRAHHAAIAVVHLLGGEQMLRMAREARIDHALDLGMLFQPGGDMHRVAAVALHAQRKRLDAAER